MVVSEADDRVLYNIAPVKDAALLNDPGSQVIAFEVFKVRLHDLETIQQSMRQILQERYDLQDIAQLVSKDSSPEDQEVKLQVTRIFREDLLQHNGLTDYDPLSTGGRSLEPYRRTSLTDVFTQTFRHAIASLHAVKNYRLFRQERLRSLQWAA